VKFRCASKEKPIMDSLKHTPFNGAIRRGVPAARLLLFAIALALLTAAGCAKKELPRQSAPVMAAGTADARPAAGTEPAPQNPPAPDLQPAFPLTEKTKAAPSGKKKAPARTTTERLLQSAGRDPGAVQPEAGFHLAVPDTLGDGEAFLVEFSAAGAEGLELGWRGKTLSVTEADKAGRFMALLPVPLDEKAKSLPLALTLVWSAGKKEAMKADVPVKKRSYAVQRLKVAPKHVSPPPDMLPKIERDRAEMRAAVGKVTPRRYWSLPLLRPVPGQVTSLYGLRRVFNNVPKSPHKGLDLDAAEGDPVASAEAGTVVLVSEHYYGGKTVVVDHGLGVLTAYLHLSGYNVSVGQTVRRGDIIGFIGSTGRVTGPHLHLSLYVMGVSVNAATCTAM
jgi:murein DD-endopeptidase MepM/ murein hydrolase activator NlpD